MRTFFLILFLAPLSLTSAGHDPLVADLVDWFLALDGTYYNPKQEIRYEVPGDTSTMLGVFASGRIKKGELLCSVPWNATINAGYPMKKKPTLVCDTARNLAREMRLGDKSEFALYVNYLLKQRRGQLPSAWSDAGKDLLRRVLDGDELPPEESMNLLDKDWYRKCDGAHDPLDENAAMLVIQRAEDDLLLPVYDFYNHRNGQYLNTKNKRKSQVKFDVSAARTIEKGDQIYISYNMCSNCGNRAESFGTPHMFEHYGFVESMPQRWIFEKQHFMFDLQEKQAVGKPVGSSDEIELSWMEDGMPRRRAAKERGVNFFRKHIVRLEKLKMIEQRSNGDISVPEYEWDAIWRYADALAVAMKHAIKATVGEDENSCADGEDMQNGLCVVADRYYDALDNETDDLLYKNVPGGYRGGGTKTCDNAKLFKFPGKNIMEKSKSLYQSMRIWTMPDGDVCLELDKIVQTCAKYRPHYHELVVDFPARYIDNVRKILFVGGGDSMILAEALKYPSIEHVVGLELDQMVVRKTFQYFHTQPSFHDERVEWWFGDAIKSLRMLPQDYFGSFDLVLVDLSETVSSFAVTDKLDMLEALALLLTPDGVMIKNEWEYLDKMSTIFDFTARLYMQDVGLICDQAIVIGSNKVDFFHYTPKDHKVKRRLLGPHDNIDDRFYMFHDYQKNDARAQGKCDESSDEAADELGQDGTSSGILMIVDAENTRKPLQPLSKVAEAVTKALQKVSLSPLHTVAPASSADGVVAVVVMKEGYVTVRTWPEQKYCAFDIHLWGAFNSMKLVRDALAKAVGGSTASMSSFRVVTGGMLGTNTWSEDHKAVGPRFVQIRNCADAPVHTEGGTLLSDKSASAIDAVLEESMSWIQSEDKDILVMAVCGLQSEPCNSRDVLAKDGSKRKVITIWTCPNINDDVQYTEDGAASHMIDCERDSLKLLNETVAERGKITALVVDASTSIAMVKVVNSIFSSKINRVRLLVDQVIFMALMLEETETWRKKHNFLDRIRKEIKADPLFTTELVLNNTDGRMEIGIMSKDAEFFPRLYNATESIERRSGLDVEVRKILGAQWKRQDNYNPREYSPEDYDLLPGRQQFLEQNPLGRQSIFQLEVENIKDEMSRSHVEKALYYTFYKMRFQVEEVKAVADIGDGIVIVAILSEGSVIVVWDGNTHLDINLFAYDQSKERADKFIDLFMGKVPNAKMSQRDEQPRGTGRVVNFLEDIPVHRQAEGKGLYECPSTELETGVNDIAGYFSYYDKDNERHSKKGKNEDDYYTKGFRNVKFGGRSQTYSEMKKSMTEYKAKAFGDNLQSGDKIYEGACGEAFNILLTMEILREERGIENLTAFGSEYLASSTAVANKLFDEQASARAWIKKGTFCQADSTNLDFVPRATFDLAFTYIDPLVDPLQRHKKKVKFQDRVKNSRELCESEDKSDREVMLKEQAAQEDWHSSWVKELIRITKPGKVVIIEDVDRPVCDKSSDWGGVSVEWWKEAVSKYGWDVDPKSIEIVDKAWYRNRYNVLMRRN